MSAEASRAVFLSYASQDGDAVQRLAEALRAEGVDVWFDRNELRGGDAWDRKIRQQIRDCALFVPVISAQTQARPEGYFRLEWHLAEQRSLLIAKGRPFLVPVSLDGVTEREALVPDAFLGVQWTRLEMSVPLTEFARRVRELLAGVATPAAVRTSGVGSRGTAGAGAIGPVPDYELVRKIGEGGYGEVWLARGVTGVWRAVKIVWRARFADTEPFEREFRGVKESMQLPAAETGTLVLHHVGRNDAAGCFHYVMELADDASGGPDVNPARYVPLTLKEMRARRGRLPVAECMALGRQIAGGLAALHGRGLVHRDIKPSNIVFVNGVPKLADIGLMAAATRAQTFVGTEGYVPPEGPGTPVADVFALGRVLYELATGRDRQEFPQLPEQFASDAERAGYFRLNEVLLRAGEADPAKRYRDAGELVADLARLEAGRAPLSARRGPARRVLMLAALAVVAGGVGVGVALRREAPTQVAAAPLPARETTSVAVLPLVNALGDAAQDYLVDALTEEIHGLLALQPALQVAGLASAFSFQGSKQPAAEIGRELRVSRLVEGRVTREGDRVRVEASLRRVEGGSVEVLGAFERSSAEIFALQDDVVQAIVAKLGLAGPADRAPPPTRNAAAYDAYLRGRALKSKSAPHAGVAAQHFERAVELDPTFALAWAELGSVRVRQTAVTPARRDEWLAMARPALERALQLQPDLPEALIGRANWRRLAQGDLAGAASDLAQAEAKRPGTVELRGAQASLARERGDWAEATRRNEQALALDPRSGDLVNATAAWFRMRRRLAEADALFARAVVLQGPTQATAFNNRVFLRELWRGPEAALRLLDRPPVGFPERALRFHRLRLMAAQDRREEVAAQVRAMEAEADRLAKAGDPVAAARARSPLLYLEYLGWSDLLRPRAEEQRKELLREYGRGTRAARLFRDLAWTELLLDNRDGALARVEEWRTWAERSPSFYHRWLDFGSSGAALYARLGLAEKAVGVLEEAVAQGFLTEVTGSWLPHEWAPIRDHPRFVALRNREREWAAAQPDPTDDPPAAAPAATASVAPAPDEKSLIVLPWEMIGGDAALAAVADGLHADVIAAFSRIAELKVQSRAAALAFKGSAVPLQQIGQRAGVALALSGDVRRVDDSLRVQVQIRRTSDEAVVWQNMFSFAADAGAQVQERIAAAAGSYLRARFARGSWAGAEFTTTNAEAMRRFARARVLHGLQQPAHAIFEEQIRLCVEALQLDPNFMYAANLLSISYAYAQGAPRSDPGKLTRYRAEAKRWAEAASRMMPGGAGDGALAVYFSMVERDPFRAMAYAENEVRALPNDGNGYNRLAISHNAFGDAQRAVEMFERGLAIDPHNFRMLHSFAVLLGNLRRYPEFLAMETRSLSIHGENFPADNYSESHFRLTGKHLPLTEQSPPVRRRIVAVHEGRMEDALKIADSELEAAADPAARFRALLARALVLDAMGRTSPGEMRATEALKLMEELKPALEDDQADHDFRRMWVAWMAGRSDDAMVAARRFLERVTSPKLLREVWRRQEIVAELYARMGRAEECLTLLEKLIRVPSGITVPRLQHEPAWRRVREHPRFKALVADPRNSAPL